jgi:hypothetical protein
MMAEAELIETLRWITGGGVVVALLPPQPFNRYPLRDRIATSRALFMVAS